MIETLSLFLLLFVACAAHENENPPPSAPPQDQLRAPPPSPAVEKSVEKIDGRKKTSQHLLSALEDAQSRKVDVRMRILVESDEKAPTVQFRKKLWKLSHYMRLIQSYSKSKYMVVDLKLPVPNADQVLADPLVTLAWHPGAGEAMTVLELSRFTPEARRFVYTTVDRSAEVRTFNLNVIDEAAPDAVLARIVARKPNAEGVTGEVSRDAPRTLRLVVPWPSRWILVRAARTGLINEISIEPQVEAAPPAPPAPPAPLTPSAPQEPTPAPPAAEQTIQQQPSESPAPEVPAEQPAPTTQNE